MKLFNFHNTFFDCDCLIAGQGVRTATRELKASCMGWTPQCKCSEVKKVTGGRIYRVMLLEEVSA